MADLPEAIATVVKAMQHRKETLSNASEMIASSPAHSAYLNGQVDSLEWCLVSLLGALSTSKD